MSSIKGLVRRNAPETSVAAAVKMSKGLTNLLEKVLNAIKESGTDGMTVKDLWDMYPDIPYSSISARPAQLHRDGKIFYLGDQRRKARVMRAIEFKEAFEAKTDGLTDTGNTSDVL